MTSRLEVIDLGHRGYLDTLDLQRSLRLARLDGRAPNDILLLVQHEPTYTLGRSTHDSSLPLSTELLRSKGATVVEVERGGDVTWHGPGQLVGYPILDLRQHRPDLHWYLRTLESSLIQALAELDIPARVEPGKTGVWTGDKKIASMGIHVKQWVTLHGFALNVNPELGWFDSIVPCGLDGVTMTSVANEYAGATAPDDLWARTLNAVVTTFGASFDLAPQSQSLTSIVAE